MIQAFTLFTVILTACLSQASAEQPATKGFAVYDLPRGGVYILDSALEILTGRTLKFYPNQPAKSKDECAERMQKLKDRNQYESSHGFWSYEHALWRHELGSKIIFLVRDPRDVAIAFLEYILDGHNIGNLSRDNWFGWLSRNEQINIIIEHLHGNGISEQVRGRLGWMYMPNALTVKYENLVGPQGNGSHESQVSELKKIANHLGLQLSEQEAESAARRIYDSTPEKFQMGPVSMWAAEFDEENKELFKKHLGDVLIQLGYEQDLSW